LIELARVDGVAVAAGCRVTQKPTSERSFEFACHLIDEFRRRRPADDAERKIRWQLLDAGTSLGANTSESHGAQTDGDWITKWHISLKEGKESLFWLRLLKHASPQRTVFLNKLYAECDEIVAILVVSLRTKKENLRKKRMLKKSGNPRDL
jgi:four helix bundle protein